MGFTWPDLFCLVKKLVFGISYQMSLVALQNTTNDDINEPNRNFTED
jgi:hypothetical protein